MSTKAPAVFMQVSRSCRPGRENRAIKEKRERDVGQQGPKETEEVGDVRGRIAAEFFA